MRRNITYIFMYLFVCALVTACGVYTGEKTGMERQTANIEDAKDDVAIKEDTSTGPDSGAEEDTADIGDNSDSENKEDAVDSENDTEDYYGDEYSVYNNPIDEYYRPRIYSWEASQVERREAQDAYRKVWKQEFKNLIEWLKEKCVYEEDKENIIALERNVAEQVKIGREVCEIEMLNGYEVPFAGNGEGGETRASLPGNGTRSALNEIEGEIYRDASMRIIWHNASWEEDSAYEFRNIDYSKVTAE